MGTVPEPTFLQIAIAVAIIVFMAYLAYQIMTDFGSADKIRKEQKYRQGPSQPLRGSTNGSKTDSTTSTTKH